MTSPDKHDDEAAANDGEAEARPAPAPYEPVFNLPRVVIGLIGACLAVELLRAYYFDQSQDFILLVRAAFIPARYSGGFPFDIYWLTSPITYAFLHGGWAHLIINMIWLAAFGSPLANRIGPLRFLLFWVATSLGAVALHYALHSSQVVPLVGASGAISGMMGAAARFAFRVDRRGKKPAFAGPVLSISQVFSSRPAVTFLAVWFIINLVTGIGIGAGPGMSAQIAWEAHIGGFLVGFFAIHLFDRPWPVRQPSDPA